MKFLHLSDLHFRGKAEHNTAVLETLDIIRERYPTHKLILTGDIVDDGNDAQFRNALTALRPFEDRVYLCPGNHDYGIRGNLYSRERAERFDTWLSAPLKQGGTFAGKNLPVLHLLREGEQRILLIALDTNLETTSPFDFACGKVGDIQLRELDKLLSDKDIAHMIVIVFFHHHLFLHTSRIKKLLDARELARVLYGRVHLVLFGHDHVSKMWPDTLGIPYILAAGKLSRSSTVREITIENRNVFVQDVSIESTWTEVG